MWGTPIKVSFAATEMLLGRLRRLDGVSAADGPSQVDALRPPPADAAEALRSGSKAIRSDGCGVSLVRRDKHDRGIPTQGRHVLGSSGDFPERPRHRSYDHDSVLPVGQSRVPGGHHPSVDPRPGVDGHKWPQPGDRTAGAEQEEPRSQSCSVVEIVSCAAAGYARQSPVELLARALLGLNLARGTWGMAKLLKLGGERLDSPDEPDEIALHPAWLVYVCRTTGAHLWSAFSEVKLRVTCQVAPTD
jgi:hypothetical protein